MIVLGLSLGVPLAVVGPSVRGYAAPACGVPGAPAVFAAEIPWPQRRFGLDRLSGVADGSGVVVAVVDSGVDATNPQLLGAVGSGLDLLDPGGDGRLDCVGHGTAVASIIAARPRRGAGLVGVAPAATVLPIRVSERTEDSATGRTATVGGIAHAIRFAVDRGARVINLSLTTDRDDPSLREAVRLAIARDVVVVAAAGNRQQAGNPRLYPAAYDEVIAVGAVQPDGSRIAQSESGDFVDLVAPGGDVTAATHGGAHGRYTGTSFAAAFVAGTAALVRQYHPRLTASQVAARLTATADPMIDSIEQVTPRAAPVGMINPYRAVTGWVPEHRGAATSVGPTAPTTTIDALSRPGTDLEQRARWLASAGIVAALAILIVGTALPRATRRRWRIS